MKSRNTKKTVLLTGANGQIGQSINKKLSEKFEVYNVDIAYKDSQLDSHHLKVNISDHQAVRQMVVSINPDIVVNNAGISIFSSFLDRAEEELDDVYSVNLKGAINVINEYARINQNNKKSKSIINIGSLYGVVSADPRIYTDCNRNSPEIYAATKAGIIQLTKYYCVHLRDMKIRVNCISPGGIFNPEQPQGEDFVRNYSERCPMGKMGSAQDIANGVNFLASDDSLYINGHNLVIDGGFTAW